MDKQVMGALVNSSSIQGSKVFVAHNVLWFSVFCEQNKDER